MEATGGGMGSVGGSPVTVVPELAAVPDRALAVTGTRPGPTTGGSDDDEERHDADR